MQIRNINIQTIKEDENQKKDEGGVMRIGGGETIVWGFVNLGIENLKEDEGGVMEKPLVGNFREFLKKYEDDDGVDEYDVDDDGEEWG